VVSVEDNTLSKCSCPYSEGICKHLFVVSLVTSLPFLRRYRPASLLATATATATTTTADAEAFSDFHNGLRLDNVEKSERLERLMMKELAYARNNVTSNEDWEYILHQQSTFIDMIQKINRPNHGPARQPQTSFIALTFFFSFIVPPLLHLGNLSLLSLSFST
jgi:hypothetical protein